MIQSKKFWLLIFSVFLFALSNAQDLNWLLGTWTGPTKKAGKVHITGKIVVDSVDGENFAGTRSNEADDENHTKIVTAVSGYLTAEKFYMKGGKVLYQKDPPHNVWVNCGSCPSLNKITIQHDTVFLKCEINGCSPYCDGSSVYFKLLPDYDTTTQRQLVNLFGDSSYIQTFKPYDRIATKRQQEVDDSLRNAALVAKKRQQQINDSLNAVAIAATKRQKEIADSLENVANITKQQHEKQVEDSLRNAAIIAKRQQKEHDDSVRIAAIAAKKRQQQVDDSLRLVALVAVKRQKQVDDSLRNAALQAKRQQQHVDDSLKAVAVIAAKRQKQVDDSLKNAAVVARKKQQEVDDSLKAVALIAYRKHVDDSLKTAALKQASSADSTKPVAVAKVLEQRENVLVQSFQINTPDILIELFDNAQIDGDMVSVYHNNELIVDKQKLLRDAITLTVHADTTHRTHEFILVAENLGTIPPNTALMRITAGKQKYQLTVKTDLSNNAKIILYYDGN